MFGSYTLPTLVPRTGKSFLTIPRNPNRLAWLGKHLVWLEPSTEGEANLVEAPSMALVFILVYYL